MKSISTLLLCVCSLFGQSQEWQTVVETDRGNGLRIVFYNVENLFDTIADAKIADEEYLPSADKQYDSRKYRIKVANTAKVVRAIGGWTPPEIVGFAEVENRGVLIDVADHNSLKMGNYEIVHYDSPDPRGIDVGLIYNAKKLVVLHSEPIKVRMPHSRTRDILYVKFLHQEKDTLHIFVNHWSSRRGGKEASAYKRVAAAKTVKSFTDSILYGHADAAIVVMGDFNDSPEDESILELTNENQPNILVNLMASLPKTEGSHKYRGVWDYLDQILVSQVVANKSENGEEWLTKAYVGKLPFLVQEDDKYGDVYPDRSWKGDFFTSGFSDHLPVFFDLQFY